MVGSKNGNPHQQSIVTLIGKIMIVHWVLEYPVLFFKHTPNNSDNIYMYIYIYLHTCVYRKGQIIHIVIFVALSLYIYNYVYTHIYIYTCTACL